MTKMTADEMAVEILLQGGSRMQSRLTALRATVERTLHGGECPNCGNPGPHDDNGEFGSNLSFRCDACGEQWDAVQP